MGKLNVLVATVNITRALCTMSAHLPTIAWGVGRAFIGKLEDGTVTSTVTNMGGESAPLS